MEKESVNDYGLPIYSLQKQKQMLLSMKRVGIWLMLSHVVRRKHIATVHI